MRRKRAACERETAFRVGDRVIYRCGESGDGCKDIDGETGTVIYVDGTGAPYTVQLDRWYVGAVSEERIGRLVVPNCWFCAEGRLERIG